jgi:drug/metabolite transporter (DMT)-like permease
MTGPSSPRTARISAFVALTAASIFWGLNAVASKVLFRPDSAAFDALGLVVARSAWSLPVFLALAFFNRPRGGVERADWRLFALLGVCIGPGTIGIFAFGAHETSAAHVVLLFALIPPVTAVLSALILRERLAALRLIALGLGIAGTVLLTTTRSAHGSSLRGDACILVMVVCFAIISVVLRVLGRARSYRPLFVTGLYCSLGMGLLLTIGLALGRAGAIVQPLVANAAVLTWFFGIMIGGLTLFAQAAQTFALRTLGATIASIVASYGSLLFGLIGAYVVLGESLNPAGIAAAIILALALLLGIVPIPERAALEPPAETEAPLAIS